MSAPTTRSFSGFKPTGRLQLGNYLGAIRPLTELAADPAHDVIVCVVDLHAMTVPHHPAELRSLTLDLAATLIGCGLPEGVVALQSAMPEHSELAYLLECTAAHGELSRMIQFREKARAGGQDGARLSLLTYPVLMAADILVHRADLVPVGDDQRQHLELAVTLARRFNARYGPTVTVPRPASPGIAARVRDLRDPGSKMGKTGSDGSGVIRLTDPPDVIAATIRRAVTDADPQLHYDPENRCGVANLAEIVAALTGLVPEQVLAALPGGGGAAAVKQRAGKVVVETLAPIRRRHGELLADPAELGRLLRAGSDRLRPAAAATVAAARAAMGLLG
jgi:tryptophanyl-tRNA synthetase